MGIWRRAKALNEPLFLFYQDSIFTSEVFLVNLAVSPVESSQFESDGYRFDLTKEHGFDARAWEYPDGQHVPHGFTAGWFVMEISRVGTGGPSH